VSRDSSHGRPRTVPQQAELVFAHLKDVVWHWVQVGLVVAVIVLGILVLGWLVRWWVSRRLLDRRVGWALLPTSDYLPGKEELARVAHTLARGGRRVVRGWWSRRGSAIRFTFSGTVEGELLTEVSGPPWLAPVVRRGPYGPAVELRPADGDEIRALKGLPSVSSGDDLDDAADASAEADAARAASADAPALDAAGAGDERTAERAAHAAQPAGAAGEDRGE